MMEFQAGDDDRGARNNNTGNGTQQNHSQGGEKNTQINAHFFNYNNNYYSLSSQALTSQGANGHNNPNSDQWVARFDKQLSLVTGDAHQARSVINRISDYDHEQKLRQISNKQFPGTLQWLKNEQEIQEWKDDAHPARLLHFCGKVGSGKTIAMAKIIRSLRDEFSGPGASPVLHYFFENTRCRSLDFFQSLVKQLLVNLQTLDQSCPSGIFGSLNTCFGKENRIAEQYEVIEDILLPLLSEFNTVSICVDGIDACSQLEQQKLWDGLTSVLNTTSVKIIVSIRDRAKNPQIRKHRALYVNFEGQSLSQDIEAYIESRLDDIFTDPRGPSTDSSLRQLIKETLLNKAASMFLWVKLQLDLIEDCTTEDEIRKCVEDVPSELNQIYSRLVAKRNNDQQVCDFRVLKWACAAKKPMPIDCVRDMLAMHSETGIVDFGKRPSIDSILTRGVHLLAFDEMDGHLTPIHSSVQQFLFPITESRGKFNDTVIDIELEIARLSLIHIGTLTAGTLATAERIQTEAPSFVHAIPSPLQKLFGRQHRHPVRLHLPKAPTISTAQNEIHHFLRYAIESWPLHTLQITQKDTIWPLFYKIAVSPNKAWNLHPWSSTSQNTDVSHLRGLFGYAVSKCHLPLLDVLLHQAQFRRLPRDICNVPLPGNELLPPLHVAAKAGFTAVTKCLIRHCKVNLQCPENDKTPLHYAAEFNHVAIVDLLATASKERILLGLCDRDGYTPLTIAIKHGHDDMFRKLQSLGALKTESFSTRSDLFELTLEGGSGIVLRELITAGVIDSDYSGFADGLMNAARTGHITKISCLFDAGTDFNALGASLGLALQEASFGGHIEAVQLLLDKGASACSLGGGFGNPLQAASHGGHSEVVQLLLKNGANVHDTGAELECALHAASRGGHSGVVQLLLDNGANVDARGGHFGYALQAASYGGYAEVVQLLLDNGANVNAQGGFYGNALQAASHEGYSEIVQLLLDNGANINTQGGESNNALLAALKGGHSEVVQLLVDKGARRSLWKSSPD